MAEEISLETIEEKLPPGAEAELKRLQLQISGGIVASIVGLITFVLVLVALYAALTVPRLSDLKDVVASAGVFDAFKELREAWFGQIKDLLQLLVVSLLVPLLTTVIGYIFGRQVSQTGAS